MAVTITSTHYAHPRRDGQAELAWVAWLNTERVFPRTVTHLSTNPARRRVTSLISPTMLPVSQTDTYHISHITQESQADARVRRDNSIIPRWPPATILDFIEPVIAPFDPPTPKTITQNETWSGSDAPFARYSPLNYTVTLKLGFRSLKVIKSGTIW